MYEVPDGIISQEQVNSEFEKEWNEKLKSFVYLSGSGKYIPIKENELKTYDVDFDKIVNFL
jgi:hypothetical protein